VSAPPEVSESLIGHYAGAATRLGAFVVDALLAVALFQIGVWATFGIIGLFVHVDAPTAHESAWWTLPLVGWLFLYFWYCYSVSGKTPGKALLGLRVVRGDGSDVGRRHAAIRVAAFPLSWIPFGLGFVGIVFGRHRRALHDVIADTAVVYDFDARSARLRFLTRRPVRTGAGSQ